MKGQPTVGSLFTGIGGLDLGFIQEGFRIEWMCERDEFCKKILTKHWPEVPIYDDITELHDPPKVDVLVGGFPCQDISKAGKDRKGLDGKRSGLWWEYHRLIDTLEPSYAVIENVNTFRSRGLAQVLDSLAEIGYDAEWQTLSACAFGAPHTRERVFVVAFPNEERCQRNDKNKRRVAQEDGIQKVNWKERNCPGWPARTSRTERNGVGTVYRRDRPGDVQARTWPPPPGVPMLADGIPDQMDRIAALGNAVVPSVAAYVARCVRLHMNYHFTPTSQ